MTQLYDLSKFFRPVQLCIIHLFPARPTFPDLHCSFPKFDVLLLVLIPIGCSSSLYNRAKHKV